MSLTVVIGSKSIEPEFVVDVSAQGDLDDVSGFQIRHVDEENLVVRDDAISCQLSTPVPIVDFGRVGPVGPGPEQLQLVEVFLDLDGEGDLGQVIAGAGLIDFVVAVVVVAVTELVFVGVDVELVVVAVEIVAVLVVDFVGLAFLAEGAVVVLITEPVCIIVVDAQVQARLLICIVFSAAVVVDVVVAVALVDLFDLGGADVIIIVIAVGVVLDFVCFAFGALDGSFAIISEPVAVEIGIAVDHGHVAAVLEDVEVFVIAVGIVPAPFDESAGELADRESRIIRIAIPIAISVSEAEGVADVLDVKLFVIAVGVVQAVPAVTHQCIAVVARNLDPWIERITESIAVAVDVAHDIFHNAAVLEDIEVFVIAVGVVQAVRTSVHQYVTVVAWNLDAWIERVTIGIAVAVDVAHDVGIALTTSEEVDPEHEQELFECGHAASIVSC